MKFGVLSLALVAGLSWQAHASAHPTLSEMGHRTSGAQLVSDLNTAHLTVVSETKTPPPLAAWKAAVLNTVSLEALPPQRDRRDSFLSAANEILELVYPQQIEAVRKAMTEKNLYVEPSARVRRSVILARAKWRELEASYKRSSAPTDEDFNDRGDYEWRPTPPQFARPLLPNWGTEAIWSRMPKNVLVRGIDIPDLNSRQYVSELAEVYALGGKDSTLRTAEQSTVATFWAAGAGTVTPPGMWMATAAKMLSAETLREAATKMTILAQAVSDAGCMAWYVKYSQKTWRPVTAIAAVTGNSTWEPYLPTPPFPSFVSGHSTFSSAGATVVEALFHPQTVSFESQDVPGLVKTFSSARAAADEAGMSRIYGGIHYQADNVMGLELGRRVGCAVLKRHGMKSDECRDRALVLRN